MSPLSPPFVDETLTEVQDAAKYVFDILEVKQGQFGIAFLGFNEKLRPEYPAVIVYPGGKEKVHHGTHKFLVAMEVLIAVYHGKLNLATPFRTLEDLSLVTKIENELERDPTWGDKIVFGFVARTVPRTAMRPTGEQIIATQMAVAVESRKGFPYYGP